MHDHIFYWQGEKSSPQINSVCDLRKLLPQVVRSPSASGNVPANGDLLSFSRASGWGDDHGGYHGSRSGKRLHQIDGSNRGDLGGQRQPAHYPRKRTHDRVESDAAQGWKVAIARSHELAHPQLLQLVHQWGTTKWNHSRRSHERRQLGYTTLFQLWTFRLQSWRKRIRDQMPESTTFVVGVRLFARTRSNGTCP